MSRHIDFWLGRSARQGEGGFTLAEVLISLALVAMLTAGLVSGLGSGMRIWEVSDQASEGLSESTALESLLHRHLSRAVPVRVAVGRRLRLVYFEGTPERILFFTSAEAGAGPKGIYGEELRLRPSGEGTELVVRRSRVPLRPDPGPEPNLWDEAVVSAGPGEMRFVFYARPPRASVGSWSGNWTRQRSLPTLVGLSSGEGVLALARPEFVVAPRTTTSNILLEPETVEAYFGGGDG